MRRGYRGPSANGLEYEALGRWKRLFHWAPGVRAWIKRCVNKRDRRDARLIVNFEATDCNGDSDVT